MFLFVDIVLFLVALGILIPVVVLFIECSAALLPTRSDSGDDSISRPRVAVLVPAHNEASGISATLETILPQLKERDRLVVVADNCSDDTALIAERIGAEYPIDVAVKKRKDSDLRGKGYALDYGLQFIKADPPDVVVMIDADCIVQEGAIERIASVAVSSARPVQATYLMKPPLKNPKPTHSISALAFMVKNLVRPRGLAQLRLPCLLTGSGMAFPWSALSKVSLASGNIVEDMQLGIDLAIAGYPPVFCEDAEVTAFFSEKPQDDNTSKQRWIHGYLTTLLTQTPRLLKSAVEQRRFELLALALELCVLPLSLLVMIWTVVMGGALVAGATGASWIPAIVLAIEGVLLFIAVIGAWAKFGRSDVSLLTLLAVPFFVLRKIPIFVKFVVKRQIDWVRGYRNAEASNNKQNVERGESFSK